MKIALLLVLSCLPMMAQAGRTPQVEHPSLWDSGNAFLAQCDESSPNWVALSWDTRNKAAQLDMCTLWLTGFLQGVEVLQQFRPFHPPSQAEAKADAEYDKFLKTQYGIEPDFEVSQDNVCIPGDSTNNQRRLIVVRWMKDNPKKLTLHGAYLAYAALQSAYPCKHP